MERRSFGSTNREVSVIGQGTWYIETGERARAIAAPRRGLDLGMNHIETAEMYGAGEAEEVIAIHEDALQCGSEATLRNAIRRQRVSF